MSWRLRFRRGSFRGVPFHITGSTHATGRRVVVHEYPGRDTPYTEDLGRKARTWDVECFVVEPGYMAARDALVRALEQPGPGTLVHPYLGTHAAVPTAVRVTESSTDGGMATFSITFSEAGAREQPGGLVDTRGVMGLRADSTSSFAESAAAGFYTTRGFPSFVHTEAQTHLGRVGTAMEGLTEQPGVGAAGAQTLRTQLAQFNLQLGNVSDGLTMAREVTQVVQAARNIGRTPGDSLRLLTGLVSFGEQVADVAAITPSRIQQGLNQTAVTDLVQRNALLEASRAATDVEFASFDDAIAVRDSLAASYDLLSATAPDQVYNVLQDSRVAMVADITTRGASLARVARMRLPQDEPALVLSHRLYGTIAGEQEVVRRNHVRHPGAVAGGVDLEVLTR